MWKKAVGILLAMGLLTPAVIYANSEVYVGGDSVGIAVQYDGVMVSGTYTIQVDDKTYNPSDQGFKKGDIIKQVDGVPVTTLELLYQKLSSYHEPINDVPVTILRDGKQYNLTLTTLYNADNQTSTCGLYVKDEITGVGTVTFYNPENNHYGALGHEIMDPDLQQPADINTGHIYESTVEGIAKAQPNVAGEKQATIQYNKPLGTISKNTAIGIYGTYDKVPNTATLYEWASRDEVHTGPATIETVLNGNEIQTFEILITKVNKQDSTSVKGIEFEVTDKQLLAKTNGIIQGMSGSPIIQNNKLIGAVTHVVTANPIKGYGVYIEWMMKESE